MGLASDIARSRPTWISLERLDDPTKTWVELEDMPVPAFVEPQGQGTYRFRIRYRDDLRTMADIEPAIRILYDENYLDLTDIIESARLTETQLIASRRIVSDIEDLGSGARRIQAWP